MSDADNYTIAEDINQSKMVVNWLKDGDVFEPYILMDPESELSQFIGIPCVHGRTFCLVCYRKCLNRAEDVHFTNGRRLEIFNQTLSQPPHPMIPITTCKNGRDHQLMSHAVRAPLSDN